MVRVALCSVLALAAGCGNKKLRSEMEDLRAKMEEIEEEGGRRSDCEVPDNSLADDSLARVLRTAGVDELSVMNCGQIRYQVHGLVLDLFRVDEGDLMLKYTATGCEWKLSQINEWNRTRRLSRAYLEEDGDPVLEADLVSVTGITEEQVAVFVDLFHASAHNYAIQLAEYCES